MIFYVFFCLVAVISASSTFNTNLSDRLILLHNKSSHSLSLPPVNSQVDSLKGPLSFEQYALIISFLDYPSLLVYSKVCKTTRANVLTHISRNLFAYNRHFLFREDQLNRIMHYFLFRNGFFNRGVLAPMQLFFAVRNREIFLRNRKFPPELYDRIVFFVAVALAHEMQTFDLVTWTHELFNFFFPFFQGNQLAFHHIYLLKSIIEDRETFLKCLVDANLKDLNSFFQLFHQKIPVKSFEILKSIASNHFNQIVLQDNAGIQEVFDFYYEERHRAFKPSYEKYLETLTSVHELFSKRFPNSLFHRIISLLLTPETEEKTALFWLTFSTLFTNETFYAFKSNLSTWWSAFYCVIDLFLKKLPEFTDWLLDSLHVESIPALEEEFISALIDVSPSTVLKDSAFLGHAASVKLLLNKFNFSPETIDETVIKAASTDNLDVVCVLLEANQISTVLIEKALVKTVQLNNFSVFKHLITKFKDFLQQVFLNNLFLKSVQNHSLNIFIFLITESGHQFPAKVFEDALNFLSAMPSTDFFKYLVMKQQVYRFPRHFLDNLLFRSTLDPENTSELTGLLEYAEIFSDRGAFEALNCAIGANNHVAVKLILNCWTMDSIDASNLLESIVFSQVSPEIIASFLSSSIEFRRETLFRCIHLARNSEIIEILYSKLE